MGNSGRLSIEHGDAFAADDAFTFSKSIFCWKHFELYLIRATRTE